MIEISSATVKKRAIKSFVRRSGRLTAGQQQALDDLGRQFIVPFVSRQVELSTIFNNNHPIILEIGFGMGDATAEIAKNQPLNNYLACEVHQPGVGSLLMKIKQNELANVRIISHDVVEVLQQMLKPNSLSGVHVFFPDPWHKKRHHKRRLIQTEFVNLLISRLKVGGYINCATDWHDYAAQMLTVFSANQQLVNCSSESSGYAVKPAYRPLTKFENRGLKLGHGVWDLFFKRQL